jgi:hypothetical protein
VTTTHSLWTRVVRSVAGLRLRSGCEPPRMRVWFARPRVGPKVLERAMLSATYQRDWPNGRVPEGRDIEATRSVYFRRRPRSIRMNWAISSSWSGSNTAWALAPHRSDTLVHD